MAKSNVLNPARQIILWIAANAGGVVVDLKRLDPLVS
jgi:hypothetical protein